MKQNVKIAITGGIGSGKSLACEYLADFGYNVVSCDEITKKLYNNHAVKVMIKNKFNGVISGDKRLKIDKKKLANEVFSDERKKRELEDIIHPLVLKKALSSSDKKGINFIEVPILFERDYKEYFDGVIVVLRAEEERIKSVMLRSTLTEEDVKKRILSQVDYNKTDLSDCFILDNNESPKELKNKLKVVLEKIEEKFKK